jgi:hypothetical protein
MSTPALARVLPRVMSIVVVTAITLIVWAFAEAESLRALSADIDVVLVSDPASGRTFELVEPKPASTGVVRVSGEIEGPAGALAQVERILRDPVRLSAGDPGVAKDPGLWPIDLREALRNHPLIRGRGIIIRRLEPSIISIRIDELVERTLPIQVELPAGETDGPAESRPRTVTAILPKAIAETIPENAYAIARIDQPTWDRLVPGRRETIPGVRIEIPGVQPDQATVKVRPLTCDVSLAVRTRTATLRVPTVPVHVRMPPVEMALFDVSIPESDRVLIDVTVSGPADLVKQIEDKTIPLIATVTLTYEDLERGITSKETTFHTFPTALRFEVANRTVRLKISRREKTGP